MDLDECFKEGLLRRGSVDTEKIASSIEISEDFLEKAKKVFNARVYDVSLTVSYTSMFHAARILLFRDGLTERSHVCIILCLKEKYKNDAELVNYLNILDSYRSTKHHVQYGSIICSKTEALEAIDDASNFLEKVKSMLETKRQK